MNIYKTIIHCTFIFLISLYSAKSLAQECFAPRYKHPVFRVAKITPNIKFDVMRKNEFGRSFMMVADLYEPKGDTVSLRPVIFLIHGGAHVEMPLLNRKSPDIVAMANDLAKRGYVVISPEYRLIQDFINPTEYKTFIKALYHSIFDIHDAVCFFVDSYHNGNPHRIDINRVFIGGVSSGSLITVQSILMNSLSELDSENQTFAGEVESYNKRTFDGFFENKFCGANILGALCLSTALFDTTLIKKTENAWFFSHDKSDNTTPFSSGKLLKSDLMPVVYGPGSFAKKLAAEGVAIDTSYFDNGLHPVFLEFSIGKLGEILGGISLETFINPRGLQDLIFDIEVLDSTVNHISQFCFNLLECKEEIATGLFGKTIFPLTVYPNPTNHAFYLDIPYTLKQKYLEIQIIDISGKIILTKELLPSDNTVPEFKGIEKGTYLILINEKQNPVSAYLGKIYIH